MTMVTTLMATMTDTLLLLQTTMTMIMAMRMAMVAPWLVQANGKVCTQAAAKLSKLRHVKSSINSILNAGDVQQQAAVLCAVADHPVVTVAQVLARIDSSKEIPTAKFVCQQSSRMMGRACSGETIRGKTSQQKGDAAEVMMIFSKPSHHHQISNQTHPACMTVLTSWVFQ